jgi:hypothetical protein
MPSSGGGSAIGGCEAASKTLQLRVKQGVVAAARQQGGIWQGVGTCAET